jgi:membrane-bound lytic murein transglycosylase B
LVSNSGATIDKLWHENAILKRPKFAAQFMPSRWARYAVDFDGDRRIDLFASPANAIGSVANCFKAFNWQPGMPTHYPMRLYADKLHLIELQYGSDPPSYVAGTDNFHALTRYNWSRYYAMAVIELENAVAQGSRQHGRRAPPNHRVDELTDSSDCREEIQLSMSEAGIGRAKK